MTYYSFQGLRPVVGADSYVHPTACLIGDVVIGQGCYIGAGAVLRGDMGRITVGDGANVQDNCVVHGFPGREMKIEDNAHVGHGAIIHGCHLGRNCFIGMNAVLMDDADIGENSFIGAMSFVRAGLRIPSDSLAIGLPARVTRALTEDELAWKREATAVYHDLAAASLASLVECQPLSAIEAGRAQLSGGIAPLGETRAAKA